MNIALILLATVLASTDQTAGSSLPEVTFEYFNLSTNEIWVTDVLGLPPDATPGRLLPVRNETPLEVTACVFSEPVRVKRRVSIVWKDNGTQGWKGGLNPPGSVPAGITRRVELKRKDFGIPARLTGGKVRFTYIGADTWRVRLLTSGSAVKGPVK